MKNLVVILLCTSFIGELNSSQPGWSSWSDCTESLSCFRRIFTCVAGKGLKCVSEADGAFEQVALNCSANSECLKNIEQLFPDSSVSVVDLLFLELQDDSQI